MKLWIFDGSRGKPKKYREIFRIGQWWSGCEPQCIGPTEERNFELKALWIGWDSAQRELSPFSDLIFVVCLLRGFHGCLYLSSSSHFQFYCFPHACVWVFWLDWIMNMNNDNNNENNKKGNIQTNARYAWMKRVHDGCPSVDSLPDPPGNCCISFSFISLSLCVSHCLTSLNRHTRTSLFLSQFRVRNTSITNWQIILLLEWRASGHAYVRLTIDGSESVWVSEWFLYIF